MGRRWLLAVTALGCVSACVVLWWPAAPPPWPTLKTDGGALVAAAETYRGRHGEYPPSLATAGVAPPPSGYGPWRYERLADGRLALAVGDYGRDGFVLSYLTGRGWYLDD